MKRKSTIRENGKYKVKIENDGYSTSLLTMTNGWQWSGATMTPELAKLSIEALEKYLTGNWDSED